MSKGSRFSSSQRIVKSPEEEMPMRLQSIMFPRPELLTPTKKKFLPNTSTTRVPKLNVKRKSSELAAERPRSSSISEIQHSLSSTVLISHTAQDPREVMQRSFKKPPVKVAFGLSAEEKAIKSFEETQKKERNENTWLQQMDIDSYPPITLPFFENATCDNTKIEEGNLLMVQLPDKLPCEGPGKVGKLRIFKSGKMEMLVGGQAFQVFHGVQSTFYQEIVKVGDDQMCMLGPVSSQLVVAPRIS